MADGIVAVFLLYGLVFGIRRGFYKELIAFGALVAAVFCARALRGIVGGALAGTIGSPLMADLIAAVGIFVVVALVINIIGRVILNRLRNPDGEDVVEEGADSIAEAIADKGKKGPMTLLTDPISRATSGLVYWSDKLLGAALGLVKGAVGVALFFAIVITVARYNGTENALSRSIEGSTSARVFNEAIEPLLLHNEDYRFLRNVGRVEQLAAASRNDPRKFEAIAGHPNMAPLRAHPKVVALAQDPQVLAAWKRGDAKALILNPRVREILADPSFRSAFAEADLEAVLREVSGEPEGAPAPKKKEEKKEGKEEKAEETPPPAPK